MAKPRGPSAYMLFTEERRSEVQTRLRQESADCKVAATVVAKALGDLWKLVSEEDKDLYRQKAQERAAAATAAAAAETAAGENQEEEAAAAPGSSTAATAATIPQYVVKRIMLADDEVQRVSADALWAISAAAKLFLQQLAVKGAAAAGAKKRKTVKLEDFSHVVRSDHRLVEAGLKDIQQRKALFEAAGTTAGTTAGTNKRPKSVATPLAANKAAAKGNTAEAGSACEPNQQQQGQEEQDMQDASTQLHYCACGDGAGTGAALTDEQRIELDEQRRKKAAEAAKVRAVKAVERKAAKDTADAASTHRITTFFVRNRPDPGVTA